MKIFAFVLGGLLLFNQSAWAAAPHVPLGMNANVTAYYSEDFIFKDMMKKMLSWNAYDTGKLGRPVPTTFDPDGYPVPGVDYAGYWTWIGIHLPGGGYLGDYVLTWSGDGEVTADNNGSPLPGLVAGDHRVTFPLTSWPELLTVRIKRTNPANPVKDIALVQALYEHDYKSDPYHPDFVRLMSTFHTFRFMDLAGVSSTAAELNGTSRATTATTVTLSDDASSADDAYKGWFLTMEGTGEWPRRYVTDYDGATKTLTVSPAFDPGSLVPIPTFGLFKCTPSTWAERRRPTSIIQTNPKGLAIEHMVGLCNKAKVNPWFCIPTTADRDYIRQMAVYVKNNLDPSLKVYLEWSNETWNYGYPGFTVGDALGKHLGIGGAWAYHAYWATHIFHIWNEVYGLPDLTIERGPNPLVRVLASQAAWVTGPTTTIVNFSNWRSDEPFVGHKASEFADAVGIAPYFGEFSVNQATTLSQTELLNFIESDIAKAKTWTKQTLDLVVPKNLDVIAYEGGQGFTFAWLSNEDWARVEPYVRPVMYSQRWRSILVQYLEMWSAFGKNTAGRGVDLFCLFNFIGGLGKYGHWGHRDQQVNPSDPNPRWQGILDYLGNRQTPVPPRLFGEPISGHEVLLRWYDDSHNESAFEIERKIEGGNFGLIKSLTAGTTTHVDSGLDLGQTYVYRARAINTVGASEYSNELRLTMPLIDVTLPRSPTELVAVSYSNSVIQLTWRDQSHNESKFIVERKDPGATSVFVAVAELPSNTVFYIDDGLAASRKYTYRIKAAIGAWSSLPSNEASATTWADSAIPAGHPTRFTATLVPPADVQLNWKDNDTTEKGYRVKRKSPDSSAFTLVSVLEPNVVTYRDRDLAPGVYLYRLEMIKADDTIVAGDTVMIYVPSDDFLRPVAPENLIGQVPVVGRVELAWVDRSDNETGFVIERKARNSSLWNEIGRTDASVATYQDFPNILVSESYRYRVKAVNQFGNSPYSNEVEVFPGQTGGGAGNFGGGSGGGILPSVTQVGILCKITHPPCTLTLQIVGRLGPVRTLIAEASETETVVIWDIRDDAGLRAPSGVYRISATCGNDPVITDPKKLVVIN